MAYIFFIFAQTFFMKNKIVVYTALFGNYSGIIEQPILDNVDYICYTDQDIFSDSWKITKITPPVKDDNTRSNRYYKILPHKHLKEYQISIYIDANFLILKDFTSMILQKLKNNSMLCFDHNQTILDKRNCIYLEHEELEKIAKNHGVYRDSIETMQSQINFLRTEKYPEDNGLISAGILIRNHHDKDVIALMELWWDFVKNRSKRDQLSFNYAVWKLKFNNIEYLKGDIRSGNPWFYWMDHKKDFSKDIKKLKKQQLLNKIPKFILVIIYFIQYPILFFKIKKWCHRYTFSEVSVKEIKKIRNLALKRRLYKEGIIKEIHYL